jgi:hypothetical protein
MNIFYLKVGGGAVDQLISSTFSVYKKDALRGISVACFYGTRYRHVYIRIKHNLKNDVFWKLLRVALVRTDVSEELSASFIRVTRIDELGTTLAVTSNRRTLRRNTNNNLFTVPKRERGR